MHRRRFFRPRGRDFGPAPHPMLQRANELMAIEDYPGAARAYEELAKMAKERGGPASPYLYIQAGRAHIRAGNVSIGISLLNEGLQIFANANEWIKFLRNRRKVVDELNLLGLQKEANALFNINPGEIPGGLETLMGTPRTVANTSAVLPTKCLGCGAPLRKDEVEWIDEMTAECPYCGNIARCK
jgi:predicted RNA-binding Zn-ribbon protein involved in translation (DUF1610 family)